MIPRPRRRHLLLATAILGSVALIVGDLQFYGTDPGAVLSRAFGGLLRPDLTLLLGATFWSALGTTMAIALGGTALGVVLGGALALSYDRFGVRTLCAGMRGIHELLWALLLLPPFGTGNMTGILAIALPAAGFFGKVFAEIREEADPAPERGLPLGTGAISRWAYAVLPTIAPACRHYIGYRFECGLRASAVLGFVGVHTIGFELESFVLQGEWPAVWAYLLAFIALVAACRWILRPWSAVALTGLAVIHLACVGTWTRGSLGALADYGQNLVPWTLRRPGEHGLGERLGDTWSWLIDLLTNQAIPGLWATVVLSLAAGAIAVLLGLGLAPLASRRLLGQAPGMVGDLGLIVVRTIPAYVLAYAAVLICGPSMLPGIIALAIHNAAILGHLSAERVDAVPRRAGGPRRRLDRLAYEIAPRVIGPHLAYGLYRFEFVLRESAILGVIGVATIGFHIDSAIEERHHDEALILVLLTAALIIAVDRVSGWIRRWARLRTAGAIAD